MISREDIESYLIRTEMDFEEIGEGIWLVHLGSRSAEAAGPHLVVSYSPPVVLIRSPVLKTPDAQEKQLSLFRRLLELNVSDMVHGAFGLEDGEVILSDTLELEDLDYSEFLASVESMSLALSSHRDELIAS